MKPRLHAVRAKDLKLGYIVRGLLKLGLSELTFVVDTVDEEGDFGTVNILFKDGLLLPAIKPDEYFLVESRRRRP